MHGEMKTSPDWRAKVEFYLTGGHAGAAPRESAGLGLLPALFGGHLDLASLRYGFPMILAPGGNDASALRTLTEVIEASADIGAASVASERLRHHALRLEMEIRRRIANGARASLYQMTQAILDEAGRADTDGFADSVKRLRSGFAEDGELVDCDADFPGRAMRHAFAVVQRRKVGKLQIRIGRLAQRLGDILQADDLESSAGRGADKLRASIGASQAQAFDFEAMSRLLDRAKPPSPLPESRRRRIEKLLAVLKEQARLPAPRPSVVGSTNGYIFESASEAIEAYRRRLPRATELIKALAMAELEIEGRYDGARHDRVFDDLGDGIALEEMGGLPDYLVMVSVAKMTPREFSCVAEAVAAGLPMKFLLQTDDIVCPPPAGGKPTVLARTAQALVEIALGLGEAFVLQTSASHLPRCRDALFAALDFSGTALVSVFSGASGHAGGLPPYLVAAAALESRAFPALNFDPSAGASWASRFSIAANPQPGREWPVHALNFEDSAHNKLGEDFAFTLADFLVCDDRFASDFAPIPREAWDDRLVPVARFLAEPPHDAQEALPTVMLIDRTNVLHKAIPDAAIMRETRRCLARWRALQERGGVNNSHVALARREWEKQAPSTASPNEVVAPPAVEIAESAKTEPGTGRSPDEAFIETARCSSCNECTQINNKMFAYDKNKQAYIADLDAGTYRQLVEAAEACQVSVIRPGKPRNPREPGLEELVERARTFV